MGELEFKHELRKELRELENELELLKTGNFEKLEKIIDQKIKDIKTSLEIPVE